MSSRPRCRDWTALATQQLRLRNLIQISGHNIIAGPAKCSVYFTLHHTSMSAPFFTSEKLDTPQYVIWPDINCPSIAKSPAHSVCIRIWRHLRFSASSTSSSSSPPETSKDEVLFVWGVYFAGLVPISKRTDVQLRDNSLVFHIHGGFFTHFDCLLPVNVPAQLDFIGIPQTRRRQFPHKPNICDTLPPALQSLKLSSPSKSLWEIPTAPPLANPSALKVRYIEKLFYATETRNSYTVDKLMLLQRKQRQLCKQSTESKRIRDEICMRSAFCLDPELIAHSRPRTQPPPRAPSTTLTLNRLLFKPPELLRPEDLLRAQEIRKQIETARFRNKILLHEREEARNRVRKLQLKIDQLSDLNTEKESWLLANYHELRREMEMAERMAEEASGKELVLNELKKVLMLRRHQLLRELGEVYSIERNARGVFTINGAELPSSESFTEYSSPAEISVALGYAAHLTTMCAIILDLPLRNRILLKGSASRIRDDIKVIPENDREFPLYVRSRSCPPPMPLRYAVFLLNQNIGQMRVWLGADVTDNRETLFNLLKLMWQTPRTTSESHSQGSASGNGDQPDGGPTAAAPRLLKNPLLAEHLEDGVAERRICRSVESFNNDLRMEHSTTYGSAPNLAPQSQLTVFADSDDNNI